MPVAVPVEQSLRLVNHGPVTLVTTAHGGRRNVMAAGWLTPVRFSPPRLAVVVGDNSATRPLLVQSRQLVVNIPSVAQAARVDEIGRRSGAAGDKFADLGIPTEAAAHVMAPRIPDCVAWIECELVAEPGHELYICQVISAWCDDRAFADGRWTLADPQLRTLHSDGAGRLLAIGDPVYAPPRGDSSSD